MFQLSFVAVLAAVTMSTQALGGYVGSVVGIGGVSEQVDSLQVLPGDQFIAAIVLTGPAGTKSDSAIFRLELSAEGVIYSPTWAAWSAPYETGGIDDLSVPGADDSGVITRDTYPDPLVPNATDIYFENVTSSAGSFFSSGVLVELTLRVPSDFTSNYSFTIRFVPDTFTDGASFVEADEGSSLTINVVPSPHSALILIGLTVLCSNRRSQAVH